ncbi:MAG TPA: hypothetical protein VGL48_14780 [Acidimicrobiales bacterium]|jgi:hypothetical protein
MSTEHRWVSSAPGSRDRLPEDVRQEREQRHRERDERRGGLLAIVSVRVYEHDEEPQVSFPPDALLGVETDAPVIAEVVARARTQLGRWR